MDYNEVNNCMTEQQKMSLSASAIQSILEKKSGVPQEYTNYDDVNNQLSEQQKLSLIASALTQLKDMDSSGGGQYVLELYTDLSTSSTIELASEDDGTVSDATLYGVNVADFIDFVTHTGTPYLHHNLLSSYNLVVIASDAAADVDTYSSSVASVFARGSGKTDPETLDPIQEFGILFTAYDSTNSRFKEYEGVVTESGGVWSITIREASFGYDNADNMEF